MADDVRGERLVFNLEVRFELPVEARVGEQLDARPRARIVVVDEVDQILEQAAIENDPVKRVELFNRLQVIIAREVPDITLVGFRQLTIYNKKIKDFITVADGPSGSFADAYIDAGA